MEQIYIETEKGGNVWSCVDFFKRCYVITHFPELSQKIGQRDVYFLLHSSSRAFECRNERLLKLESYVDQIDTILYHDIQKNKRCFKDPFIFQLGNDIRDICRELFRK